jgi:hypothetical protein
MSARPPFRGALLGAARASCGHGFVTYTGFVSWYAIVGYQMTFSNKISGEIMQRMMVAALAMVCATASYSAERTLYVDNSELLDFTYNWESNNETTTGSDGILYRGLGIGGPIFGKYVYLTVNYPVSTYIDYIYVRCDDNIGSTKSAKLQVWLDGKLFGEKDVSNTGSSLSFAVRRNVRTVWVQSVHSSGNAAGEETRITQYQSYKEL